MQRKIIVLLLFILVTIIAWGLAWEQYFAPTTYDSNVDGWETVVHEEYGFTLETPSGWDTALHGESGYKGVREVRLRVDSTARGPAWITIFTQFSDSPTMDSTTAWGRIIARQKGYHSIASQVEETVDSTSTIRTSFEKSSRRRLEQLYLYDESTMLIIQFEVESEHYESYIDTFNRMVDSFSWNS